MLHCRSCKLHKPPEDFNPGERDKILQGKGAQRLRQCRECSRAASKKFREANKEKMAAWIKDWTQANPEKRKAINARGRDKVREKRRAYRSANPLPVMPRELVAANEALAKKRWAENNPDKLAARLAKRRATKKNAQPAWANTFFLAEAYRLAKLREKMTGFKWHVDHVVPLVHKLVCGLHVEHNLQVIPATENFRKSNAFHIV